MRKPEEIEKEMEALTAELKEANKNSAPEPLTIKDYAPLHAMVTLHIDKLANGHDVDDSFDHFVFETVMEIIYGEDIWDWYNKNCDN